MPLRKLWNSICGRTHGAPENTVAADSAAPTQREIQQRSVAASQTPLSAPTREPKRSEPVKSGWRQARRSSTPSRKALARNPRFWQPQRRTRTLQTAQTTENQFTTGSRCG